MIICIYTKQITVMSVRFLMHELPLWWWVKIRFICVAAVHLFYGPHIVHVFCSSMAHTWYPCSVMLWTTHCTRILLRYVLTHCICVLLRYGPHVVHVFCYGMAHTWYMCSVMVWPTRCTCVLLCYGHTHCRCILLHRLVLLGRGTHRKSMITITVDLLQCIFWYLLTVRIMWVDSLHVLIAYLMI